MKANYLFFAILFGLLLSCNQNPSSNQGEPLISIPDSLSIFAEGRISGKYYERDLAISPDGQEIYYTLVSPRNRFSAIMYSSRVGGEWSKPEIAHFSGQFRDLEPAFHPDGNQLFFASNRNEKQNGLKDDFDIWYVQKEADEWSDPIRLDTTINTAKDEYYPSLSSSGNLYFTATYEDSKGREDIYLSRIVDGKYQKPESLDTAINTASFEFNAFVSPDESYIVFSSFGRPDGKGGGDLYMSVKDENGNWKKAEVMSSLNSSRLDYSPFVLGDSLLFFTSERTNFDAALSNKMDTNEYMDLLNSSGNGEGDIYFTRFEK